jgi:uncharacterized repeat protein (TIGR03803 family)
MQGKQRFPGISLLLAMSAVAMLLTTATAIAQTDKFLHSFDYNPPTLYDGKQPEASLVMDAAGNLYGTTTTGGKQGWGTVFELSPRSSGGWSERILHNFNNNGFDGTKPFANVILDAAGNLYGTTSSGGFSGAGIVFELVRGSGNAWTEKILYTFRGLGGHDGAFPFGGVIFDAAGNLFGTTLSGGKTSNGGTAFELTPTTSGPWTETILFSFTGQGGSRPMGNLIFDSAGNLYGMTEVGGAAALGNVYELSPSSGSWSETVLYAFQSNGVDPQYPAAGLVMDSAGNLYGTAVNGGQFSGGAVFELSNSGGTWSETILHQFNYSDNHDGINPSCALTFDAAGNLYGTTAAGGNAKLGINGLGTVFKLTPSSSGWTETIVHNFQGKDGQQPEAGVIFDAVGNIYGTTQQGGIPVGDGIVFEITP